jgi:ribosomal protein S18 acetylase RimI-like enzyme
MIAIRNGTVEDASKISELLIALSEEFIVGEFSQAGRDHFLGELNPDKMKERLSGAFRFYLAEEDEELAGVAAIRGNTHLYYLFVAKSYQGQGLAKRLWSQVREDSLELGNLGRFTVNASNHAVRAYERLGFIQRQPTQAMNGVLFNPMEFMIDD